MAILTLAVNQIIYIVVTLIIALMFAFVLWITLNRKAKPHYESEGRRIIDDEDTPADDSGLSGSRNRHGAE